jgi:hypothetical protein
MTISKEAVLNLLKNKTCDNCRYFCGQIVDVDNWTCKKWVYWNGTTLDGQSLGR